MQQLKESTIELLENMSRNYEAVLIRKGNVSYATQKGNSFITRVKFEDDFEHALAIYQIKDFISKITFLQNASIQVNLNDNDEAISVSLIGNGTRIVNTLTEPEYIPNIDKPGEPEGKIPSLPKGELQFHIAQTHIASIKRALTVMKCDYLTFKSVGDKIVAILSASKTLDQRNENFIEIEIDTLPDGAAQFTHTMSLKKKDLIEAPYDVNVVQGRVMSLEAQLDGVELEYFISLED